MSRFDNLMTVQEKARSGIDAADAAGLPICAYIPMRGVNWEGLKFMEDPPVAYLNQMEAKRIASNAKKRAKRFGGLDRKTEQWVDYTSVVGITVIIAPRKPEGN